MVLTTLARAWLALAVASSAAACKNTALGSGCWFCASAMSCSCSFSFGLTTPILIKRLRKNCWTSSMPSPSMFIIAILPSTCKVSGSCVICIIPVIARTVAAFLLLLDGPTSAVTSKLARLKSFSNSIAPVSSFIIGRNSWMLVMLSCAPTFFMRRFSST